MANPKAFPFENTFVVGSKVKKTGAEAGNGDAMTRR
jgi:hypothetical protein